MAKSSSIYMGEGKMALSGKWGSALSACMVAMAVTMVPSFLQLLLIDTTTQTLPLSTTTIFFYIFSFAWAFCVSSPLLFACVVGLRQMHISNESPLDVMIEKFKKNISRYIVLELKIALRILVFIAIPLVIYLICIFKGFMEYGDMNPSSQYGGIASLSMFALVIIYIYKTFEFIFVPFIHNDNPDLTDNEILDKSALLSKGYKWTMFKIMLRAILPAFAILIVLGIAFSFVFMGALIGGIAAAGAGYDFSNLPASSFGMTFLFIYMIIMLFLAAFIQTRMVLPFSVLYSELTGYNNNDQNDQGKTPVAVPENVIVTDPEENTNKEEEKKEEPEIPYEQRYMPR
ncbi:MAG: DUF975 family protein [Paludibacteraceae bacterium]|nr:DUF975 family protein [Paludibacteraceae bacterium]